MTRFDDLSLTIDCDILIAGDDLGRVWIYDVNRCLCESRQGKKLEELKETQVRVKGIKYLLVCVHCLM